MKPNVIVILADDLGYSDLGCFGGEVDTPNIDRIAQSGVSMSSFYVTPRCSPSRAALMTGRQPHTVGIGILTADDRPNGYPGTLDLRAPTMAERLREHGYVTALAGKWHLSSDARTPNDSWPTRRGFDEFHGILHGCASYYQPRLVTGETPDPPEAVSGDYYITDDLTDTAVDFVQRSAAGRQPFFLYLAYTAPHWPLHARETDIARYRARYAAGWDELRSRRSERLARLGLGGVGAPTPRDGDVPAWEDVDDREWEIERMAVYAAQIEVMDRGIGRLLDELERNGELENTLIMFSSDNGACAEPLPPNPDIKVMNADICPPLTRSGQPVQVANRPDVSPGPEESYSSYGRGWANLSNTPFRLYKRWVHEGGISSPLVASWPAGRVSSGQVRPHLGHIIDILPTVMHAAGVPVDDVDGVSLLKAWQGEEDCMPERALFWEHIGNAAVRRGRWKLVREAGAAWELYDISADRCESVDLSGRESLLVDELAALWQDWADRAGVLAWDDVLADYRRRGLPELAAKG